jgi:ABC-type transport system substrate-binding protein
VLDWMFFFPIVEARYNNPTALQNHAYGSGPFVVQSYAPDNQLVLKKNPHYYNPSQPKVNTVEVKFFSDSASMVSALQFGQLDSAEFVDYNYLSELEHKFTIIHGSPSAETAMFYLNPELAPFNVKGCRQAVLRAINRTRLLKVAQGGQGYPVPGPFTPGSAGYDKALLAPTANGYNLAAARAGIAKYCKTKTATAVVQPSPAYTQSAMEIISYDLQQAGFDLKLAQQDNATFVTDLHLGTTQAALYPTVNPFLSPPSLLTNRSFSPLTDNYWWGTKGAPADYRKATAKIQAAVTPAQTKAAVTSFNAALADQAWVTGLFTQLNLFVVNKKVSGFTHNPADMVVLNNVVVH